MRELIKLLSGIRNDIDFETADHLISGGVLDSLDIELIVSKLSIKYKIDILSKEITPDNFDSLFKIDRFINTKK